MKGAKNEIFTLNIVFRKDIHFLYQKLYQCNRVPLRNVILDIVRTERFLFSFLGGNEGFEFLEKVDLFFFIKRSVMQIIAIRILKKIIFDLNYGTSVCCLWN